jgi:hypothetical protein
MKETPYKDQKCSLCYFAGGTVDANDKPTDEYQCRKNAPVLIVIQGAVQQQDSAAKSASWPEVSATDWCGEFKTSPIDETETTKP